jgi:hypothetical protein
LGPIPNPQKGVIIEIIIKLLFFFFKYNNLFQIILMLKFYNIN